MAAKSLVDGLRILSEISSPAEDFSLCGRNPRRDENPQSASCDGGVDSRGMPEIAEIFVCLFARGRWVVGG